MCSPRLLVHESHAAIVALVRLPARVHHYVILPLLFHPEPYNSRKCKLSTWGSHPGNLCIRTSWDTWGRRTNLRNHSGSSTFCGWGGGCAGSRNWPGSCHIPRRCTWSYKLSFISVQYVGYKVRTDRTLDKLTKQSNTICFVKCHSTNCAVQNDVFVGRRQNGILYVMSHSTSRRPIDNWCMLLMVRKFEIVICRLVRSRGNL